MKTAIILSDTHGNTSVVRKLDEIMRETDYIIHLGDGARDIADFRARYPEKVISVLGNCDGGSGYKKLSIEGVDFLITHGHDFGVKSGLTRLKFFAEELGVKVAFYGHTHTRNLTTDGDITFVNPGTLKGWDKSYAYAVFNDGKCVIKLVELFNL